MFTIIGLMLTGMLLGYLLRKRNLSKIHKVITVLIWVLKWEETSRLSKDCTPLALKPSYSP